MPYNLKEQKLRKALVKKYGLRKGLETYEKMETQAAQGKAHVKNFGATSMARRKKRLHIS